VLRGATLIDGRGGSPVPNAEVVLNGGEIVRVGRAGEFRFSGAAAVTDLPGRFILPGFVDMHVHPRVGAEDATMRMLLAFGVTTISIPGVGFESPDSLGFRLRDRIDRGDLEGPRVFTAGKIIEGPHRTFPTDVEVRSQAEMRVEVRRQAALGADLVKLYWSTPVDFIRAAVEEAHAHGLQVAGHLRNVSWTAACEAGIDRLVHSAGDGPNWELLPAAEQASARALPYRARYARFEHINPDGPELDSLIACLVRRRVSVDPTLVVMRALYFGDDLAILHQMEPQVAPPSVLLSWGKDWQKGNPFVLTNVGGQDLPYGKNLFRLALQIVRKFQERGVLITSGTDVGMPWITPGVSLHRELELMSEAGIPTAQVLSIATRNGAIALNAENKFGTIAPGLAADLVVLRADPTARIQNTRSIELVYKQGHRYDPQQLMSRVH